MLTRNVLTSTTSARLAPAAARMSRMFSMTLRVCARMSSCGAPSLPGSAPAIESSARRALVPETKMKSPARRKCGKVPRGRALPATTALPAVAARPRCAALPAFGSRTVASLELHADVHGLGEEGERMRAAFAADARQLHPAERRAQIAQEPVIHPDDADLHGAG